MRLIWGSTARNLRGRCNGRYRDVRDEPELKDAYPAVSDLVGVYTNPVGVEPVRIVFSETAILLEGERPDEIAVPEIVRLEYPPEKLTSGRLVVHLTDGRTVPLLVEGRDGNFQDAWLVGAALDVGPAE